MRTFIVASMVMTVFLTGCDPVGLRRVCVQLPQRPNDSATIEIHRPDVQEVLRVLDAVVEPLGFKASPEPSTNDSIRVYWLNWQPATVEGRSYSRNVPIHVIHTPKGIEVAFGHFGFLGARQSLQCARSRMLVLRLSAGMAARTSKQRPSGAFHRPVPTTAAERCRCSSLRLGSAFRGGAKVSVQKDAGQACDGIGRGMDWLMV